MARERKTPPERTAQLLDSAMRLAKKHGYLKVTRVAIAADTGTSEGLVNRYIGDKHELRKTIMRNAVKTNNKAIIAQGVAADDPIAKRAVRQ